MRKMEKVFSGKYLSPKNPTNKQLFFFGFVIFFLLQFTILNIFADIATPTPIYITATATIAPTNSNTFTVSYTFTNTPTLSVTFAPLPIKISIKGETSEITGTTNGSIVNPSVGPVGTLVVNGTGSVNFAPAQVGDGVYFTQGGQQNSNTAYYKWTGAQIGDIFNFNMDPGEINFYLKSNYSFAQRQALPRHNRRTVFTVKDDSQILFTFNTEADPEVGRLVLTYQTGGTSQQTYYIPAGQEDALFGQGVILKVTLDWNGSNNNLYLNDNLVSSQSYSIATSNWTANSMFCFGADIDPNYGPGWSSCDDIVDEFNLAIFKTPKYFMDHVAVEFQSSATEAQMAQVAAAHQCELEPVPDSVVQYNIRRLKLLSPQDIHTLVDQLKTDPLVLYSSLDYMVESYLTPDDPCFNSQWGLNKIKAPNSGCGWEILGTGDSNVTIAIVDTGVDPNHLDLTPNLIMLPGANFVPSALKTPPYTTSFAVDDNGHGTHVAGIAAGVGNNHNGIAGTAWNCKILPVKVLPASGGYPIGYQSVSHTLVCQAIKFAADQGAKVINCSLGCVVPTIFLPA